MPLLAQVPKQLSFITGTEGNDTLLVNKAAADALDTDTSVWLHGARSYGGDDVLIRDRTGDYYSALQPVTLHGGGGHDTVV